MISRPERRDCVLLAVPQTKDNVINYMRFDCEWDEHPLSAQRDKPL